MDKETLIIIINDLLNRLVNEKSVIESRLKDDEMQLNSINKEIDTLKNFLNILNSEE